MTDHEMTELLYTALASELGVVARSSSSKQLRQRLYAFRKKINDEALSALSFTLSPTDPDHDLWIIKRGTRNGK